MKKRITAWIISTAMAFSLWSVNAFAEETEAKEYILPADEIRIDTDMEIGSSEELVMGYIEEVFAIGRSDTGAGDQTEYERRFGIQSQYFQHVCS